MKVTELMTTDLQTITADDTVADAIIALADWHVHGLPVLDKRTGRLIGVLSTSDVLEAAAECAGTESTLLFMERFVGELMTSRPAISAPDDDVQTAAQQMLYLDVHRLFVEDEGQLVGVISQSDIVGATATAKI